MDQEAAAAAVVSSWLSLWQLSWLNRKGSALLRAGLICKAEGQQQQQQEVQQQEAEVIEGVGAAGL
jgi:hypothetical protein